MVENIIDWVREAQRECFGHPMPPAVRQTDSELSQIKEKILPRLSDDERAMVEDVPVVLLSLVAANAHAFRISNNNFGVCFDYAFEGALRVVNELLLYQGSLMLSENLGNDLLAQSIRAFASPQKRVLRDQMRDIFLVLDDAKAASEVTHEQQLREFVDTAVGTAGYYQHLFLLGHEFAHILCGHISSHRTLRRRFRGDAGPCNLLELCEVMREDEGEADAKAAEIVISVLPEGHLEHAYDFISAMFELFSIVESIWIVNGIDLVETHPPASERQRRTSEVFSKALGRPLKPGGYDRYIDSARARLL